VSFLVAIVDRPGEPTFLGQRHREHVAACGLPVDTDVTIGIATELVVLHEVVDRAVAIGLATSTCAVTESAEPVVAAGDREMHATELATALHGEIALHFSLS
jgi:hypothetical protein